LPLFSVSSFVEQLTNKKIKMKKVIPEFTSHHPNKSFDISLAKIDVLQNIWQFGVKKRVS
jgi:hypothetical protein